MANLEILILFVCFIVNITAFFPTSPSLRNKISENNINNKEFGTCSLSASATSVVTNATKFDNDKQKWIFYKIVCNDENIKETFVGYTTQPLESMWKSHENKCNNIERKEYHRKLYEVVRANGGLTNWSIVVLEECHFSVETEARRKKREWTEKTPNNVNMRRPITFDEERKEEIRKAHREYYIGNKVAFLEYNKKYHIDNRETILEKQKKYDNDHKYEKREYDKKRYEANKDEMNEKSKQKSTHMIYPDI
mmetsp:Transcript_2343/g.2444  ORF Transcript_2343/g.2444 Transcript_2343/m.2444 type:complete len:251 (+) Transcript_2343:197-949(+)